MLWTRGEAPRQTRQTDHGWLGRVCFERSYYLCPHCHQGNSPQDRELDVKGVACSPGVRRMVAVVGSDTSSDQGREQLQLLAGAGRCAGRCARIWERSSNGWRCRRRAALRKAI